MFTLRYLHNNRIHFLFTEMYDTAIMTYEALADAGYAVALWQGTKEVRPEANRAK